MMSGDGAGTSGLFFFLFFFTLGACVTTVPPPPQYGRGKARRYTDPCAVRRKPTRLYRIECRLIAFFFFKQAADLVEGNQIRDVTI